MVWGNIAGTKISIWIEKLVLGTGIIESRKGRNCQLAESENGSY